MMKEPSVPFTSVVVPTLVEKLQILNHHCAVTTANGLFSLLSCPLVFMRGFVCFQTVQKLHSQVLVENVSLY